MEEIEWIIYGQEKCSQCVTAKLRLKQKNQKFEYVDLTNDPEKKAELVAQTGARSMPMIFRNGKYFGGVTQVLTYQKF